MRILSLMWPTNGREELMINSRRDMLCPATDGLVDELLNLGHQVVCINIAAEEYDFTVADLACPTMLAGLPCLRWKDVKRKDFDVVWHNIKDPTPPKAIEHVNRITAEFEGVPIWNDVNHLRTHTKQKYISTLFPLGCAVPIQDNYTQWLGPDGRVDPQKCFPPGAGAYVSLDKAAIRLHLSNNDRSLNMFHRDGGITLRYFDNEGMFHPGLRSFFRVPYAAGKCLEGTRYHCPAEILCPKSGHAKIAEPFSMPAEIGAKAAVGLASIGVTLAHLEGINVRDASYLFDVNPFPSSFGVSLTPMSVKIAKRLEQVYDV